MTMQTAQETKSSESKVKVAPPEEIATKPLDEAQESGTSVGVPLFMQRAGTPQSGNGDGGNRNGKNNLGPLIQAKMHVNAPDDEYEQEADRMADSVMRSSSDTIQRAPT